MILSWILLMQLRHIWLAQCSRPDSPRMLCNTSRICDKILKRRILFHNITVVSAQVWLYSCFGCRHPLQLHFIERQLWNHIKLFLLLRIIKFSLLPVDIRLISNVKDVTTWDCPRLQICEFTFINYIKGDCTYFDSTCAMANGYYG